MNIYNKVLDIINSNIEDVTITREQADDDLTLIGMDSITFIKIIVDLEENFEIEIPDEKLIFAEMGTLNKMVDVVLTVLGGINERENA